MYNSYNDGREVTHPGIFKALAHAGILQRGKEMTLFTKKQDETIRWMEQLSSAEDSSRRPIPDCTIITWFPLTCRNREA